MDATQNLLSCLVMLRALPDAASVFDFARVCLLEQEPIASAEILTDGAPVHENSTFSLEDAAGREMDFPVSFQGSDYAVIRLGFVTHPDKALMSALMNFANMLAVELDRRATQDRLFTFLEQGQEERKKLSIMARLATSASGIGVWEYDIDRVSLTWNDQMFEIYGLPGHGDTPCMQTWRELIVPEDRDRVMNAMESAIENDDSISVSFKIERPNGDIRHLTASAEVFGEAEHGQRYLIGTNIDVTEQVEMTNGLSRALRAAHEADHAKTAFLATVSHELRTPLNAIIGMSETMSQEIFGAMPDKYREYSVDILDSGRHLLTLVDDLLDVSRIETGGQRPDLTQLSLFEVVNDSIRFFRQKIDQTGQTVLVDVADGLPVIMGDQRAVKQIVTNLLSNALKFGGPGVTVSISLFEAGDFIGLSVSDDGPGMSQEFVNKAVMPFTRDTTDAYSSHEGWGLGLSITASLVKLHEGELIIDSKPGEGTTVKVLFPRA